jgi:hypothetical protein
MEDRIAKKTDILINKLGLSRFGAEQVLDVTEKHAVWLAKQFNDLFYTLNQYQIKERFDCIMLYLKENQRVNINDFSFKELYSKYKIFEEEKRSKNFKIIPGSSKNIGEIFLNLKKYKWVKLSSEKDIQEEGQQMGNCLANTDQIKSYTDHLKNPIYSLRDENNKPKITVAVRGKSIVCIEGQHGMMFNTKYFPMVQTLFKKLNISIIDFYQQSPEYLFIQPYKVILNTLMKATVYQRNEILLGIGDLFESCDTEFHIAFISKLAQDLKKRKISTVGLTKYTWRRVSEIDELCTEFPPMAEASQGQAHFSIGKTELNKMKKEITHLLPCDLYDQNLIMKQYPKVKDLVVGDVQRVDLRGSNVRSLRLQNKRDDTIGELILNNKIQKIEVDSCTIIVGTKAQEKRLGIHVDDYI